MGRGHRARGPIAFMPSDGRFLGSKDLQGYPVGKDGLAMPIRVVEVLEYPPGEEICGKKMKLGFWAIVFEAPPDDWLEAPWDAKPSASGWVKHAKEWKIGPEVAGRLALRLGHDTTRWIGEVIPLRLEVTTFGREDVYGVRPVPFAWEDDPKIRREAMRKIAEGTYRPPGLSRRDVKPDTPAERQPGEDDESLELDVDTTEPPDDWQPGA